MRHRFIENNRIGTATAEYALLDANEAFANDKILGYNILTTDNEGPREQYIIQGGTMGTEPETVMNATRVEERLHQKAESMSLKQSLN
ncbi:hypothetical protein SAMN04489841_2649 [Natrinema salaciae]|uniref:Uncharacterized protein n=2 Tax=Natrinema salaciae TaxID=1186196 RepID=A0A1H9JQP5_9EURY|nr:hypothetical protein SAMN04489841_2649 [Natrinema salaciae]